MSKDAKDRKVEHVIDWLEKEHGATVVRVRGSVVIVQAGPVSPDGVIIQDAGVAVDTFVATEKEVEKWFDAAARKMLADGMCQEDALAETWPEGGGACEAVTEQPCSTV